LRGRCFAMCESFRCETTELFQVLQVSKDFRPAALNDLSREELSFCSGTLKYAAQVLLGSRETLEMIIPSFQVVHTNMASVSAHGRSDGSADQIESLSRWPVVIDSLLYL